MHPCFDVTPQRKNAAPQNRIATGTMRHGGAARREAFEFSGASMYVVCHHRPTADETVAFINGEVILRPRKQAGYHLDFSAILIQVRLKSKVPHFLHEGPTYFEHRLRSGDRETRRDRI